MLVTLSLNIILAIEEQYSLKCSQKRMMFNVS